MLERSINRGAFGIVRKAKVLRYDNFFAFNDG
jgi:hypothetical protein